MSGGGAGQAAHPVRRDVCILVPTCDRYLPLAAFTCGMIRRFWPAHPPLYTCGATRECGDAHSLPWTADPRDWIGIAAEACSGLAAAGYARVYVLLDDHPPLGPCHAEHLNATLPAWMDELRAAYIGLNGWGQGRPRDGVRLGAPYRGLRRSSPGFKWKFSLHPGLWDMAALRGILEVLRADPDPAGHTAVAFERRAGAPDAPLPDAWKAHTYRVCGWRLARAGERRRRLRLAGEQGLCHLVHLLLSPGRLNGLQARFDRASAYLFRYYAGPYPLFWSGLVRKGRMNHELTHFLSRHGCRAFRRALAGIRQDIDGVALNN